MTTAQTAEDFFLNDGTAEQAVVLTVAAIVACILVVLSEYLRQFVQVARAVIPPSSSAAARPLGRGTPAVQLRTAVAQQRMSTRRSTQQTMIPPVGSSSRRV